MILSLCDGRGKVEALDSLRQSDLQFVVLPLV